MGGGAEWEKEPSVISCKAWISTSESSIEGLKMKVPIFHANIGVQFELLIQDALNSDVS